ncbi:hypothetical protein ACWCWD_36490 [Streptomyces sp. NPDC001493]
MDSLVELAVYAARLDTRLARITADPAVPAELVAGTVALRQGCRVLRAEAVDLAVARTVIPDLPPSSRQE